MLNLLKISKNISVIIFTLQDHQRKITLKVKRPTKDNIYFLKVNVTGINKLDFENRDIFFVPVTLGFRVYLILVTFS